MPGDAAGDRTDDGLAPDVATDGGMNGDAPAEAANDAGSDGVSADAANDDTPVDGANDDAPPDAANDDAPVDVASDAGNDDAPPDAGGNDASNDGTNDGGTSDAGTNDGAPPRCHWSQPFGTPKLVSGLNDDGSISQAALSPDEQVAYVAVNTLEHGLDIFVTVRQDGSRPFGPPTRLSAVNTDYLDATPAVTGDGLRLFFESTRSNAYRIYEATRPFLGAEFSRPVEITALGDFPTGGPFITPDGGALYFHSYRGQNMDLYRAAANGAGFDPPERLPVVSSDADEYAPVVTPDELVIYYQASESARGPTGIWMAARTSRDLPFETPALLPELDVLHTQAAPTPSWASPDGCRLYFGVVDDQSKRWLYVAER